MALVELDDWGMPVIPPVSAMFPSIRRWRTVKPCPGAAARRRHFRRGEPIDEACRAWHRDDMRQRRGKS